MFLACLESTVQPSASSKSTIPLAPVSHGLVCRNQHSESVRRLRRGPSSSQSQGTNPCKILWRYGLCRVRCSLGVYPELTGNSTHSLLSYGQSITPARPGAMATLLSAQIIFTSAIKLFTGAAQCIHRLPSPKPHI